LTKQVIGVEGCGSCWLSCAAIPVAEHILVTQLEGEAYKKISQAKYPKISKSSTALLGKTGSLIFIDIH